MRVFVTGGTGYVGRVVVESCLQAGHEVTLLARFDSERPAPSEGVRVVTGDLFDESFLTKQMTGCDAVIHLVGIIREQPRRGVTMDHVHFDGTMSVVQAASQAQVQHYVHMSALGTRANAVSKYHRSKWRAEEAVRRSGLSYTVFRPSIVFGRGGPGPNFISQLTDLVRSSPVTPVIGDGNTLLQPVHVQTVAEAFCRALTVQEARGKTYELGGPDIISYIDILRQIARSLHRRLRPVHVPMMLMKPLTALLQRIPAYPITQDQLVMLDEGNVCADLHTVYEDLHLSYKPFSV